MIFDKDSTKLIKGYAIILMLCNHLFPILEWIYEANMYWSIPIGSKSIAALIGGFSKICVSMFAFLTGYGFYYSYKNCCIRVAYFKSIKRLISFLTSYWIIICLVYIPVLAFTGLLKFDTSDFVLNLFAIKTTYIRIAWYVRFYILLVFTFPLLVKFYDIKSKYSFKVKITILIGTLYILRFGVAVLFDDTLIKTILCEYLEYTPIVLVGVLFAEQNLFYKISNMRFWNEKNQIKNLLIILFIWASLFVSRGIAKQVFIVKLDIIYAPIFVFSLWWFSRNMPLMIKKFIQLLGGISTELWFLHAIFFIGSENVQRIAYWPKISVLILIWVVIILMPIALLINKIKSTLMRLIG